MIFNFSKISRNDHPETILLLRAHFHRQVFQLISLFQRNALTTLILCRMPSTKTVWQFRYIFKVLKILHVHESYFSFKVSLGLCTDDYLFVLSFVWYVPGRVVDGQCPARSVPCLASVVYEWLRAPCSFPGPSENSSHLVQELPGNSGVPQHRGTLILSSNYCHNTIMYVDAVIEFAPVRFYHL